MDYIKKQKNSKEKKKWKKATGELEVERTRTTLYFEKKIARCKLTKMRNNEEVRSRTRRKRKKKNESNERKKLISNRRERKERC